MKVQIIAENEEEIDCGYFLKGYIGGDLVIREDLPFLKGSEIVILVSIKEVETT